MRGASCPASRASIVEDYDIFYIIIIIIVIIIVIIINVITKLYN